MDLLAWGTVGYVIGIIVTRQIIIWRKGKRDPYYGLPEKVEEITEEEKQHVEDLTDWDKQFFKATGKDVDFSGRKTVTVKGTWSELDAPGMRAAFQPLEEGEEEQFVDDRKLLQSWHNRYAEIFNGPSQSTRSRKPKS